MIDISPSLANSGLLSNKQHFGQYGKISYFSVYQSNLAHSNSYCAHVCYEHTYEAAVCILSLDKFAISGKYIRCTFGATKYCESFLNGYNCKRPSCSFIHNLDNANAKKYILKSNVNQKTLYSEFEIRAAKIICHKFTSKNNFLSIYPKSKSSIKSSSHLKEANSNSSHIFPDPLIAYEKAVEICLNNNIKIPIKASSIRY